MVSEESVAATSPPPGIAVPRTTTRQRRALAAVRRFGREALSSNFDGKLRDELRAAQRDVILERTIVLIWISVFVMPTTIWSFMYFSARDFLGLAIWIVLGAI